MMQESMKEMIEMMDGMDMQPEDFEISKLDTEDAGMMQESMKEMIEMMDGMDMQPEDFDKMQNMVVCNDDGAECENSLILKNRFARKLETKSSAAELKSAIKITFAFALLNSLFLK